jgi:hypothetical protein
MRLPYPNRWDGTAIISRINDTIAVERKLIHARVDDTRCSSPEGPTTNKQTVTETHVRQVVWSPDGQLLATRTHKGVRVWEVDVSFSLFSTFLLFSNLLCIFAEWQVTLPLQAPR